ncbi:ABC transporter substrate-binding protein [Varunaivibrio sulfuroxidans]|uniref:ABC-type Fe3+-hydroxamate transport system substrate-binding protein n=1 Tax=Varunaivibrio sulfuroxidans TaxID=1773489 RepID=A0A4R3JHD8_9PROT|nr:ABC transporter substrate-binding protein [Varunaivibrio sulfuroxidans]TCS64753.1 ABC-type Fe3+-hydroxamate transport system substrate-binding protein [Varunaivibrio sulfuroxidans]WES29942.1 ABC transporter substrate-binding protein [Varunaivibrio sulfuroxidans]
MRTLKKTVYLACLVWAFALPVLGFSGVAHAQITITDVLGRERTIAAPAKRVLLGFYFEDFLAITGPGAYDRVVGISKAAWHDWRNSQWKAYAKVIPRIEKLADIGGTDNASFNLELAISLHPDVAILATWQFKALGDTVGRLEAAGIPVVVVDYNAQTVPTHVLSTQVIGAVMGAPKRAKELADAYAAAVTDVEARIVNANDKPMRVYVELGNKGAGEYGNSYGNGYMWGGVINLAGAKNIADGKISKVGPLNPEYVIAQNPQLIMIPGSYWVHNDKAVVMGFGVSKKQTEDRLAGYLKRPGWAGLDAVKAKRVLALYHGGARTLYDYTFLQYLAKALHPTAFKDVDPEANLRRFYARYLPIKADGSFMATVH